MSHAGCILAKYPAAVATVVLTGLIGVVVAAQVSSSPYHLGTGCDKLQGRKIGVPSGVRVDPDGKHLWILRF
jgi:hypothetical protein